MHEEDFIFATVTHYNSLTGYGTATYSDEEGQLQTVSFEASHFSRLRSGTMRESISWDERHDANKEEPEPTIAFTEIRGDKVEQWTNERYARAFFVWARSTYYVFYEAPGDPQWDGYLTSKGEVHSTIGTLPRELDGDMYFERFVEGDEEFDSSWTKLSDTETIEVWKKLQSAQRIFVEVLQEA